MWHPATVAGARQETATARTLTLSVPGWRSHRAGQHVDVRLSAEDGYQAARSYSLSSAPGEAPQITVERLPEGEVSPYLVDVADPGDAMEVRGPLGGYFVWEPDARARRPLLLVAGGSGVAPLRAMLRQRWYSGGDTPLRLLYSARSWDAIIYREELLQSGPPDVQVILTLTRSAPDGWSGRRGRVDVAMLDEVAWPPTEQPEVYVCGPTSFVENVASTLVKLGHPSDAIRTERFGASS